MEQGAKVYVWDLFIRLFHWSLAICIFLNYYFTEEGEQTHQIVGYVAASLVIARLFWGFITKSPYSQFKAWLPTPSSVINYLKNFKQRPRFLTHNPLAAMMMIYLMTMVIALGITGFMMDTDRFFGEEWLEQIHELLAHGLMLGVCGHIIGALHESYHTKENLIASMIHGYKRSK